MDDDIPPQNNHPLRLCLRKQCGVWASRKKGGRFGRSSQVRAFSPATFPDASGPRRYGGQPLDVAVVGAFSACSDGKERSSARVALASSGHGEEVTSAMRAEHEGQ